MRNPNSSSKSDPVHCPVPPESMLGALVMGPPGGASPHSQGSGSLPPPQPYSTPAGARQLLPVPLARHLSLQGFKPPWEQRVDSWENMSLFGCLVSKIQPKMSPSAGTLQPA